MENIISAVKGGLIFKIEPTDETGWFQISISGRDRKKNRGIKSDNINEGIRQLDESIGLNPL